MTRIRDNTGKQYTNITNLTRKGFNMNVDTRIDVQSDIPIVVLCGAAAALS